MAILQDLLLPSFVRGRVSRVKSPALFLSRHLGFQIGGPNVTQVRGRTYTYDIYDNVRSIANARAPSAPAGTISANPIGVNTVTLGMFKEKLPLDYGMLLQIRKIGSGASDQDVMGGVYIDNQVRTLRQRQDNGAEFLAGAIFQGGKYYYYFFNDDWVPTYNSSGAAVTVDLKYDSDNVLTGGSFAAGLQMGTGSNILTASWATAGTDIPANLDGISSAFQDIVGAPLKRVYCGTDVWNNVIQNTLVRQLAGTAAKSAEYNMEPDNGPDGTPTGFIKCTLVGRPWYDFYVWDGSLNVAASISGSTITYSNTKLLPRNYATFTIDLDGSFLKAVEGSDIVKENDMAPPVERVGFYAWAQEKADPARVWYHTQRATGVELNMPKAIAYARVQ